MKKLSFILICLIFALCLTGCLDDSPYEEQLRTERNEKADPETDGYELKDGTKVYFEGEKEDNIPLH